MKKLLASVFTCLLPFAAWCAKPDNVVLTKVEEEYIFTEDKTGNLVVKTDERKIYEATRHSCVIQPYIYYNDVITLDKASGGKLEYRNVNSTNIFHDDSKICFFKAELKSQGDKAKSQFKRTFTDPAYLTEIALADEYPIREKVVTLVLPSSLQDVELLEVNFPKGKVAKSEVTQIDGSRKVTYTINDLPALCSDKSAPVSLEVDPYIVLKGYFPDTDRLYEYRRKTLDVDTVIPDVRAVLADAIGSAVGRDAIIDSIYRYVQRKVRYVAYEEGEAGYRPDRPAEVLRKNYGDCKGMALLLATLLNRVGIEANIASIGTKHIPYKISEMPSLGATNHMICIVPAENDTLILDATCEYISSRDIPCGIQGKDAMMFTSDGYKMVDVPKLPYDSSTEEYDYEYEIKDGVLTGSGNQLFKGDIMEALLTSLYGVDRNYKSDVLVLQVKPRRSAKVNPDSIKAGYKADGTYEISVSGLTDPAAVADTGEALYVDISPESDTFVGRIDLADRRSDYEFPFPCKIVRRSTLAIPEGYKLGELPKNYQGRCGDVQLECEFTEHDGNVTLVKTLKIESVRIPLSELTEWNRIFSEWTDASNHQIELLKL